MWFPLLLPILSRFAGKPDFNLNRQIHTMKACHTIYLDIETGPLSDAELESMTPEFEAPGNFKDPDKIAANIAEQKIKWKSRAALSPFTGRVLCVGVIAKSGAFSVLEGDESKILTDLKHMLDDDKEGQVVGFNTHSFDWPFLQKRAWMNNVPPPLRPGIKLYHNDRFVDLRLIWQMGDRAAEGSLGAIAKFFKLGEKAGSGADFAGLWETDKDAALDYLRNDLGLTKAISERMGIHF